MSGMRRWLSSLWFLVLMVAVAHGQISVGRNVQVSKANADRTHAEVLLAADPNNPKNLLGCSMIEPKGPSPQLFNTIAYVSNDGGLTWQPNLEVDRGLLGSADPACAFGSKGEEYFSSIIGEKGGRLSDDYKSKLAFYRSFDSGKTWSDPVDLLSLDREYITVDTRSEKYKGRVYVHANGDARAVTDGEPTAGFLYFHSSDSGKTFSIPALLAIPQPRISVGHANGAILSDGTYVAIFWDLKDPSDTKGNTRPTEKPNATMRSLSSDDGGVSFGRAVTVGEINVGYSEVGSLVPSTAVDMSDGPFRDRIYVAWPDYRSGRCEILLSSSSDKGKTWAKPVFVNDDYRRSSGAGPDDFMPAIAVNSQGVIGVMWYDRRDNPDDLGYWVRFSASLDGGETFLPSVRVSEAPSSFAERDWRVSAWAIGGGHPDPETGGGDFHGDFRVDLWPGHTVGMAAAADDKFFPFWVDNRTGLNQIWTTPVSVSGRAYRNGSADLDGWTDISSKLSLEFSAKTYDPKTKSLTADAYLLNTSKEPINGPLRLRFTSLRSRFGAVKLVDALGESPGPGAVVTWTKLPPEGLNPGARSGPQRIRFVLPTRPALSGETIDLVPGSLMDFELKALAPPKK